MKGYKNLQIARVSLFKLLSNPYLTLTNGLPMSTFAKTIKDVLKLGLFTTIIALKIALHVHAPINHYKITCA